MSDSTSTNTKMSADPAAPPSGWVSDVQRAIALILVIAFAIAVIASVIKLVISADVPTLNEFVKIVIAALINMVLIALGFFFGSNQSKNLSDARTSSIVEKLTGGGPPTPPIVVVSWWSLMTAAEQDAIKASANAGNAKVQQVFAALQAGKATKEDLDFLVSVNLLTKERYDILTSASPPINGNK